MSITTTDPSLIFSKKPHNPFNRQHVSEKAGAILASRNPDGSIVCKQFSLGPNADDYFRPLIVSKTSSTSVSEESEETVRTVKKAKKTPSITSSFKTGKGKKNPALIVKTPAGTTMHPKRTVDLHIQDNPNEEAQRKTVLLFSPEWSHNEKSHSKSKQKKVNPKKLSLN